MQKNHSISALILAGGRGSRMGHVDKGLQPFRGTTMAQHVLERLMPQVGSVAINANQNLAAYGAFGVPVWPDETIGFAGPLAGLEAGLRHCTTPYLLCAPCDSPFLPDDLAARLLAALQAQDADIALAVTHEAQMRNQWHPVFCLVKTALLPVLSRYLAAGGRKMDGWYTNLKVAEVLFEDGDAFCNINTLDELHRLDTTRAPRLNDVLSCLSDYDPEALPVHHAQQIIGDFVRPIDSVEKVALRSALGRVLAADILSPISVPAYDNSAMDGYALRGADLRADGPTLLRVIATVYAGHPTALVPVAGDCVRIMTGGVMPAGCDSVIAQEQVASISERAITIDAGVIGPGDNRRLAGEDLMKGSAALKQGRIIRPADLGLLASLGIAEVAVRRRLRVAFFSTGDELRSVGEPLDTGCVYDSNRYSLYGMLTRLGCDIIDMGIVKDDPQALEAALRNACENADAIVTSGGVSVGAADYTRQIMVRLGEVAFWKLGMRPGRPLAFGQLRSNGSSAFLFGLPGNPVAVMVSFYFFARAALLAMMGADAPLPLLQVASAGPIRKKRGRTEYQRGVLSTAANGAQQVSITGAQGSGILSSMSQANCMLVLHDAQGDVAAGEMVDVLLFEGLI